MSDMPSISHPPKMVRIKLDNVTVHLPGPKFGRGMARQDWGGTRSQLYTATIRT